ncbi:MAG: DUF421 domain-containing protein [Clostridia bacterium]|nr:DUF421 domain-containing protein [Clostridia bacterium]
MGLSFARTIILYISVIIAMRIMGKRTIGEMHPTELVVSIMISDLATVPMQSKSTPLLDGIVPIFTLVILELVFAFLVLKSRIVRRVLVGRSCSVTKGGKLLEKEMASLKITVDDIEEQIRINGYTSLKDVEEIVIETNGQVSVIGKKEKEKVPYLVVTDGKIRKKDMQNAHIGMLDIEKELKRRDIADVSEVLYMSAIDSKIVHLQKRGEK